MYKHVCPPAWLQAGLDLVHTVYGHRRDRERRTAFPNRKHHA